MVKPTEKAILVVGGDEFADWETVYVKHAVQDDPHFMFRFTCSEGMPLAKNYAKLRIKPGHACTVILAGELAITARVEIRQVFFDAHRHHIEIQGSSRDSVLAHVGAVTKDMEFRDKTPLQLISSLAATYGVGTVVEGGTLPNIKIPVFSLNIGETVKQAQERVAKTINDKMPGKGSAISFTSNPMGDFVVIAGRAGGSDDIVEGQNMISGREYVYSPAMNEKTVMSGQRPVTDNKKYGPDVSFIPFLKSFSGFAGLTNAGMAWSLLETAAWNNKHLQGANANESGFLSSDSITVTAVVHGWLKPSGGLWRINQNISVKSPMLILNGSESLWLFRAEFTQDDQTGTRTTLTLVNESASASPYGSITHPDTPDTGGSAPGGGAGVPGAGTPL